MSKIPFTVAARTAKLIGEENFSNVEGAIIELVKNSYDADSMYCFVSFSTDESGKSCITILDYGHGMTSDIIRNRWMKIGTNDKLENAITPNGRVKTGAKGIGRFALNRLGGNTKMLTITDGTSGWQWTMDWTGFDDTSKTLNEITADLEPIDIGEIRSKIKIILDRLRIIDDGYLEKIDQFTHGTLLEITNLNDIWDHNNISSLYDNLKLVVPPFLKNEFTIFLQSENDEKSFGVVANDDYDDYDYGIFAKYQKDKKEISVTIKRNELDKNLLFSSYSGLFDMPDMTRFPYRKKDFMEEQFSLILNVSDLKDITKDEEKEINEIGDFEFSFYYIKNTISDIKSEGEKKKFPYKNFASTTRKGWLNQFGGVKIYRDGFRVRPYGEKGQDWLNLGERQAKSPGGAGQRRGGFRIRPNQISGVISISRLTNPELNDKSGREGIIENSSFDLFKNVIKGIIAVFEEDRNIVMYNLSQLYNKENESERTKQEANDIVIKGAKTEDDYQKIEKGYIVLQRELDDKDEEVMLLRNLASAGLIIASFGHELRTHDLELGFRINLIKDSLKNYISEEELIKNGIIKYDNPFFLLEESKKTDENIKSWLDFSIKSIRKDRRKNTDIDLYDYFIGFKELWKNMTEKYGINILIPENDIHPIIKGRHMNLDTIFNNLLSNSVVAIESNKGSINDFIKIELNIKDDYVVVSFIDSGKGLDRKYEKNPNKIFDAMESSRCDKNGNQIGTGLGLYIVKTTLQEFRDSNIQIIKHLARGFGLDITFKMKQS